MTSSDAETDSKPIIIIYYYSMRFICTLRGLCCFTIFLYSIYGLVVHQNV